MMPESFCFYRALSILDSICRDSLSNLTIYIVIYVYRLPYYTLESQIKLRENTSQPYLCFDPDYNMIYLIPSP